MIAVPTRKKKPSLKISGKCGGDFPLSYGRDCYRLGRAPKIYKDAGDDCTKRGGYLTSILTEGENSFIKGTFIVIIYRVIITDV